MTERLIRDEILTLGGDWESGSKPQLIVFDGASFTTGHFEMLAHLPSVTHFVARNCTVDGFALACLSRVRQLDRLDLVRCNIDSPSFSALKGNRLLREIHIESAELSNTFLLELASLQQIEKLDLAEIVVPPNFVQCISDMKNLKECYLVNCQGLDSLSLETLKLNLPNAKIVEMHREENRTECDGESRREVEAMGRR